MVQKIALEEHFLAPGHETYWRTTVGNVDPKHATNLLARLTDFGEHAPAVDGRGRHRALGAVDRRPQRPDRARRRNRNARRPRGQRFSRARNPETAGPLFRLCASRDAGPARRRRRARALHARAEILRRHDQRPHPWPISRPSLALSVLGARRSARRADLHSSHRSDHPLPGARRRRRPAPRHLGMGI